jgi:hypothetical protein
VSAERGQSSTGDHRRRAVVQRLALDAAAIEAIQALGAGGIRAILLKGPAIASWLYDHPWERLYGDIDLLVAPQDHDPAAALLERLGYRATWPLEAVNPQHASTWTRSGVRAAQVDLHWRVPLARDGSASWSVLSAETEPLSLGSTTVESLSPAARAMWIALHAAQHGVGVAKPMGDLSRALERVDEATWARAADLARRLDLLGAFAVGLRLLPAGRGLAERMSLEAVPSLEAQLRSVTPSATSIGWMHLLERGSARERLRLLAAELVPSPAFMRLWSPMARRGRVGLLGAYFVRPLWLVGQMPAALRDLARARRAAGRGNRLG